MTEDAFTLILRNYDFAMGNTYNDIVPDSIFHEPEYRLWMESFGLDRHGNPMSSATPISQYDGFMAGFFNASFNSIPWSENVVVYEFWGGKDKLAMEPDDILLSSDRARSFRFTANGIINGVRGKIPDSKMNGWKFQLDTMYWDNRLTGTLYVQYKRDSEHFTLESSVSIQRCRLALVTFLQSAWRL